MKCSVASLILSSLGVVLSPVLLTSCADEGARVAPLSESGSISGSISGASIGETAAASPLLKLMEEAFDNVVFQGERRYFTRTEDGVLEQIEEVGSDGAGHFGYELIDVVTAPPSLVDQNGYMIEAENAWRFAQRLRDPRIVDADMVARNYLISTTDLTPTVAGVDCIRLRLLRHSPLGERPGDYEADVDPNTGFVLAWREFDESGQVLSSVTYESFEYDGDLSSLSLRGRVFSATPLAVGQPLGSQVSFETHAPTLYAQGFRLVAGEVMLVPDALIAGLPPGETSYLVPGKWLRLIATDGLEVTVFAHSGTPSLGGTVAGELRMSSGMGWNIGHGRMNGTNFVVASRAAKVWIQRMVASAF